MLAYLKMDYLKEKVIYLITVELNFLVSFIGILYHLNESIKYKGIFKNGKFNDGKGSILKINDTFWYELW